MTRAGVRCQLVLPMKECEVLMHICLGVNEWLLCDFFERREKREERREKREESFWKFKGWIGAVSWG